MVQGVWWQAERMGGVMGLLVLAGMLALSPGSL